LERREENNKMPPKLSKIVSGGDDESEIKDVPQGLL
jgi:hypothetical protein